MNGKPSYTSNSIAPTESAAEYAHRVLGATHPEEDTDALQRQAAAGDVGAQEALYDMVAQTCDQCDVTSHAPLYPLVTPRPSDPTELVCVALLCFECGDPLNTWAELHAAMASAGHVCASAAMLNGYICDPQAARNGHLFLTI